MEKFINDTATWLTKLEESLMNCAQTETCEALKKVKVSHKLLLSLYLSIVILILLLFSDGNKNVTSVLLPILAANQLIHDIGDSKVTDGELNAGGQKLNTNALKMESMHCYRACSKILVNI